MLLVLFLLLLVLFLFVKTEARQNKLLPLITSQVSKTLGTPISADHISIDYFNHVSLQNAVVLDQEKDTLGVFDNLEVSINLFSFFDKQLSIDAITLEGGKLIFDYSSEQSNIQHIIDHLSSSEDDGSEGEKWQLDLEEINLKELSIIHKGENTALDIFVNDLYGVIDDFDASFETLNFKKVDTDGLSIKYEEIKKSIANDSPTEFPSLPLSIQIADLNIENSFLKYDRNYEAHVDNKLDYNHIDISELFLKAKDFRWGRSISGDIESISFAEQSGLQLEELSTGFHLTPQSLGLSEFNIQTQNSALKFDLQTKYNNFSDLVSNFEKVDMDMNVESLQVKKEDLLKFLPANTVDQVNWNRINIINYTGRISSKNGKYYTENARINIDNKLKINGSFLYNPSRRSYTAELNSISANQRHIQQILPSLRLPAYVKSLENISGSASLYGDDEQITIESSDLVSSNGTTLRGSGSITEFDSQEGPRLDLNIEKLSTDIDRLLINDGNLPAQIFELGQFTFSGKYKGNLHDIAVDGILDSEVGYADIDAQANFNSDYSDGSYQAEFDIRNLHLDKLIDDQKYGVTSGTGSMSGSGLDINNLDIAVDANISEAFYDGNTYNDVTVDGKYHDSEFEGIINSEDDQLNLDFDGKISLDGENSLISFKSNLDQLDLHQFGIGDSMIWISGAIEGKSQGNTIDNIIGVAEIKGLNIRTQYGEYKSNEPVSIVSFLQSKGIKEYKINSEFIEGSIKGNIQLSELPKVIEAYIKKYIPVEFGYEEETEGYDLLVTNQNFIIDLKTKDTEPLIAVLTDNSINVKSAKLGGYFSSDDANIDLKGSVDSLRYDGYMIENIDYFFDGREEFINGNVIISNISDKESVFIPEAIITSSLNNKVAEIAVELLDEEEERTLSIGGELSQSTEYVFSFNDTMYIGDDAWKINEFNTINYGESGLYIGGLNVTKDNQNISIYTDENENGQGIEVLFDNFVLSELTNILGAQNETFEGQINGSVMINSLWDRPFAIANLGVENIEINDNKVGALEIASIQNSQTNTVENRITLKGFENDAYLDLDYGISNNILSGKLQLDQLQMNAVDPLLSTVLKDSEGWLQGTIDISGTIDKPNTNGTLSLKNVKTTPVFTNSSYRIKDTDVKVSNSAFDFGDFILYDGDDNQAFASGILRHNHLSDLYLDMTLKTDKFHFLNTTSKENELFYGDIKLSANVSAKGPIQEVKIEGEAQAIDNSNLVVSPFSTERVDYDTDFIIYADPREISLDSLNARDLENKNTYPFDVDVKITVAEDSKFELIMDPITGDKISSNGTADLNLTLSHIGEMKMYGNYTVTEGLYKFSYGVISKLFDIQKGSRVIFNGDPLDGILQVSAIYVANTAVYDLLKLETNDFTESQIAEAQKKRNMNVVLNLSQSILNPQIIMDITSQEDQFSSISDVLTNKLAELRTDPDELNNQVFGLLLFDNFILATNAETDLTQTGTDFAIKSISGLVTQQLNNLADGLLKGFELNFDINSYSSQYLNQGEGGLVTELGVGVSKSLFDERLTLKAATNINLESTSQNSVFNNIAGDFILEYRLNERGNYNFTVFRKTNFDRVLDENAARNGGSFTIRKEFGRIKKKKKD